MLFNIKREITVPDNKDVEISLPAFYKNMNAPEFGMISEDGTVIQIIGDHHIMCFTPRGAMAESEVSKMVNSFQEISEEDFAKQYGKAIRKIELSMNLIPA